MVVKALERYSINATFYLNIYEKDFWKNGDRLFDKICSIILKYGNDIQLHTHPFASFDKENRKKILLSDYSLDEQIQIIDYGIREIKKFSGIKPIAHRAGAYAINKNSLVACRKCGLKIDSSMYVNNKNCKVNNWSINTIKEKEGLIEFPVSAYKVENKNILNFEKYDYYNKVDINFSTEKEIKAYFNHLPKNEDCYVNLFMHSSSFYNFFGCPKRMNDYGINEEIIKKFFRIIRFLIDKKVEFITVSEMDNILKNNNTNLLEQKDYCPLIKQVKFF